MSSEKGKRAIMKPMEPCFFSLGWNHHDDENKIDLVIYQLRYLSTAVTTGDMCVYS